jgi:hypothetical protein
LLENAYKVAASFQTSVLSCAVRTERKGESGGARHYHEKAHSSVFSTNISTERTDCMLLGFMFLTHLQDLSLCSGLCLLIIICTPKRSLWEENCFQVSALCIINPETLHSSSVPICPLHRIKPIDGLFVRNLLSATPKRQDRNGLT